MTLLDILTAILEKIGVLKTHYADCDERIASLQAQVADLTTRIADLEAAASQAETVANQIQDELAAWESSIP